MGDKVTFGLKMKNTSTETRTIHGSVVLNSAYYTGITYKLVRRESVDYTFLNANEGASSFIMISESKSEIY